MDKISIILVCLVLGSHCAFNIPLCNPPKQPIIKQFTYSQTGQIDNTTQAHICHNVTHLQVYWYNIDQQIIANHKNCNDPLYTEDAVQIFIAADLQQNQTAVYYEFEVNPASAEFFASIANKNQKCSNFQTTFMPCSATQYGSNRTSNGWNAWLFVSLAILQRDAPVKGTFYMNLYRIDKSYSKPTRYLSWIPTKVSPPCFHMPQTFQKGILGDKFEEE